MSKIFKVISVICGIFGIISSIIMANQPVLKAGGLLSSMKMETTFNFATFFVGLILTAGVCFIYYAISVLFSNQKEIIAKIAKIEINTRQPQAELNKESSSTTKGSSPTYVTIPTTKKESIGYFSSHKSSAPWTCRSCGTLNSPEHRICENCNKAR